jgi:hypothetical protein
MSLLANIARSNSMFEDFFYKNWWRQKKNYETEIKSLNEKLKQMQEKLDGLQQKQLQGDLARGRNAITNNKFDHINIAYWKGTFRLWSRIGMTGVRKEISNRRQ